MLPRETSRRAVAAACLAAGVLAVLAALLGVDARATYGAATTADEPYYLVTAASLLRDGDLDIDDELASQPLPWHEITMDEQTVALGPDGQRLSPHDPLLPVLLAPAMAFGWTAAKVLLALLAGVTAALTTWTAVRRLDVHPGVAATVVAATFVGMPLSAYGTQVYPELPAALVVVGAAAALLTPTWRPPHRVTVVLAVVALPWLAVKYAPVAVVLAALGIWRSLRDGRRRDGAVDLALLAIAGVSYLVVHQRVYGGWTVYAVGDHFVDTGELSVVGTNANPLGRVRRLTGLFVDRGFGIAAWAPVWLLAPAACAVVAVREDTWRRLVLLTPLAAGWLTATFVALTMHGFWSPGRQVVVVLPLLVLALATWADRVRPVARAAGVLGVLGAVNWAVLAHEASTGARTLIVDFTATSAWPYRLLAPVLPDGMAATATDEALLGVWSALLVASAVAAARHGRHRSATAPSVPSPTAPRTPELVA